MAGTSLEQEDDGHWLRTHKQLAQQLEPEAVTVPARAGSLVVWHRLLPHGNVSRTIDPCSLNSPPQFQQNSSRIASGLQQIPAIIQMQSSVRAGSESVGHPSVRPVHLHEPSPYG